MNLRELVREVHRRSLWQVLGVYAGASWVVLEALDAFTDRLALPAWTWDAAFVTLLLGLPVVLATAFMQEGVGKDGRSAPDTGGSDAHSSGRADGGPEAPRAPGSDLPEASRVLNSGLPGLFTWRNAFRGGFAAAAIWAVLATVWLVRSAPGPTGENSAADRDAPMGLAVLPFGSLSADAEDAYFTDGVHEEILTELSRISALRVISRTSVMGYRGSEMRLGEIAGELGVRYVLEGSVRRFGDRVRITAQLIDADTDGHLWAETYDRSRADLFAIQSEVATRIADALQAELTPEERTRIAEAPTTDPVAHDLYLQGREYLRSGAASQGEEMARRWRLGVSLLEEAVARDPDFVRAASELATLHLRMYWFGFDRTPERRDQARRLIEAALARDPDSPEGLRARGYLHYWGHREYADALRDFRSARASLPGDADLASAIAWVHRRLGEYEEAVRFLRESSEGDPRNAETWWELGITLAAMGRIEEGRRAWERAFEVVPDNARTHESRVTEMLRFDNDVDGAHDALERAIGLLRELPPALLRLEARIAFLRGDHDRALAALDRLPPEPFWEQTILEVRDLDRALLLRAMGSPEAASAFSGALRVVDSLAPAHPDDYRLHRTRALALAGLGRADEAYDAVDRSLRLFPPASDAWQGPQGWLNEARVAGILGDAGRAVARLRELRRLTFSSRRSIEPGGLRSDPVWHAIRDDPGFRTLLDGEG